MFPRVPSGSNNGKYYSPSNHGIFYPATAFEPGLVAPYCFRDGLENISGEMMNYPITQLNKLIIILAWNECVHPIGGGLYFMSFLFFWTLVQSN